MRTILVTGGAGYIGSHIVEQLVAQGDKVIILDSLLYNQPWPELGSSVACIQGDCGDEEILAAIFSSYAVDAVVHCAARIEVGASVKDPISFYDTNVAQTLTLLQSMRTHAIKTIVFSSSAAVYGNAQEYTISEDDQKMPLNPYGQSKLFIERVLADYASAYGLRYAALRYFNVAGAYPEKQLGERHMPETHVVPLLIQAAVEGKAFNVFSSDYGTPDGTCIRDYVHVRDIARANVFALRALLQGQESFTINIGSGQGVSVLELLRVVEKVAQTTIATHVIERRSGDAARLVADAKMAKKLLGWQPQFSLEAMVRDALNFYRGCEPQRISTSNVVQKQNQQ